MDRAISFESRSVDLASESPFLLGHARVDPQAHEYAIDGRSTHLQPQTLKVLVALHDKLGQVVTRDELIDRCWNGRIVGDDVINRCISLLRHVATRSGGFVIETIPRSGYRLIEKPVASGQVRRPWRIASIAAVATAMAAIAGIGSYAWWRPLTNFHRTLVVDVTPFTAEPGSGTERLAVEAQDSVVRMLNDSGLTVKMVAAGATPDSRSADLLVSGAMSGNAQGDAATIRVESLGRHIVILSHRLQADAAHVADLPDQIGANLSSALSWTGPLLLLDEQHPSDPAFVTQLLDQPSNPDFDALAGFEFDRRNAPNEPHSAIAQLALAMNTGFALANMPREQRPAAFADGMHAAEQAHRLAPDFGDTYIPWCLIHSRARMVECEDRLRAGLSKDAQAPFVGFFLSNLMNNVGRFDDADSLAIASLAEDHYVPAKLGLAIQMEEAVAAPDADSMYKSALRLWPRNHEFFWRRTGGFLQRGDLDALAKFEQDVGTSNWPGGYRSSKPIDEALRARSTSALVAACPNTARGVRAIQCMIALSEGGDVNQAFVIANSLYPNLYAPTAAEEERIWLDHPYEQDLSFLSGAGTSAMRRDPRFLALAQRVGLLAYWRSGRMPDFCTKAHEPECAQIAAR